MTWISLVCLLALSSSAFGRSAYGSGYGGGSSVVLDQPIQRRTFQTPITTVSSYGGYQAAPLVPKVLPTPQLTSYGQQSFGVPMRSILDVPVVTPVPVQLSAADLLCQGKTAETIIPLDDSRRFVVCLDESKGVEQECPKGLFFHPESRRCERRLGPLDDACVSQPCLNGGQCIRDGSYFQCQCAPGYDGKTCELDARICQTQQPCGTAPDTRCQSFRAGAALQYICLFQDGLAYGLTAGNVNRSPCRAVDGPQGLLITDKGFIMCDGERMFIESCPGGTIWDDLNKACAWPDMQGIVGPVFDQPQGYGSSYGQTQTPKVFEQPQGYGSSYGQIQTSKVFEQPQGYGSSYGQIQTPKVFDSYGKQSMPMLPLLEKPRTFIEKPTYGQIETPKVLDSYGKVELPRTFIPKSSYGQIETPKVLDSYGKVELPRTFIPKSSYGQVEIPKVLDSYETKPTIPLPPAEPLPTPVASYGYQASFQPKLNLDLPKMVNSYGSEVPTRTLIPKSHYGGEMELPKVMLPPKTLIPQTSSY